MLFSTTNYTNFTNLPFGVEIIITQSTFCTTNFTNRRSREYHLVRMNDQDASEEGEANADAVQAGWFVKLVAVHGFEKSTFCPHGKNS